MAPRPAPPGVKYWYSGSVREVSGERTSELVARAFRSFRQQIKRCYYPSTRGWKWYGAKGIQVKYSFREFIGWYLEEAKKSSVNWEKQVCCDRIDASGHYEFGNIRLLNQSENCKERNDRHGSPWLKQRIRVGVYDENGAFLYVAESLLKASKATGAAVETIKKECFSKKNHKTKNGYHFRFHHEKI